MGNNNLPDSRGYRKSLHTNESPMIFGKVPPQAKEIEEAILGASLLEKDAFDRVTDLLKPECFYVEAHKHIFQAMIDLHTRRMPIDLLTVVEQLKRSEKLEHIGGPYTIAKITNGVTSGANIETHARIVMQKHILRELIRISGEVMNMAYDDSSDAFEVLDQAEQSTGMLRMGTLSKQYRSMYEVAIKNIQELEKLRNEDRSVTGVNTGFDDLNMVTCGWQKTDLIILAARPSVGKTAFALTLAKNATRGDHPVPVGIFSCEMNDKQLVNRVLSQESNVWLWRFRNGRIDDFQMGEIYEATERLKSANIFIDDTSSIHIREFRSKARMMKRKENVGLIIVDYLQLMRSDKTNREQEIAFISRELKDTAKELDIPIIALSQLSREIEKGGKRKPQLSDLRESGAIEQDADAVMFIHKPSEAEVAESRELEGVFYLTGAKYRNGALFDMIGKFRPETQTHEYLKVVDPGSLTPLGGNWKPVSTLPQAPLFQQNQQDKLFF